MSRQDQPRSRINKYWRLAEVLPVIGVFRLEELAQQYSGLLAAAGFKCVLVEQVGDILGGLGPGEGSGPSVRTLEVSALRHK